MMWEGFRNTCQPQVDGWALRYFIGPLVATGWCLSWRNCRTYNDTLF